MNSSGRRERAVQLRRQALGKRCFGDPREPNLNALNFDPKLQCSAFDGGRSMFERPFPEQTRWG